MKNRNFLTNRVKKEPPPIHPAVVAVMWVITVLILMLDIYRFFSPGNGLSVSDILCDAGIVAVAVYFSVKFAVQKRKK